LIVCGCSDETNDDDNNETREVQHDESSNVPPCNARNDGYRLKDSSAKRITEFVARGVIVENGDVVTATAESSNDALKRRAHGVGHSAAAADREATAVGMSRIVWYGPDRDTCGYTDGEIRPRFGRHARIQARISTRRDGRVVDGGGLENRIPDPQNSRILA
jgi:hypothetical protein